MKKELCTGVTLLLLLLAAFWNLIYLNNLMDQISEHIEYSLLYCSLEDYNAAYTETNKALDIWKNAESYTHVFIRHSDIDNFSDIFFDILSAIQNRDKYDAQQMLNKLQHCADSIVRMEMISPGSVF